MKYKVHKHLRTEARIFGLKMRAFGFFIAPTALAFLSLIGNITFIRFVFISIFVAVYYGALLFFQNYDFDSLNDNLPSELNN